MTSRGPSPTDDNPDHCLGRAIHPNWVVVVAVANIVIMVVIMLIVINYNAGRGTARIATTDANWSEQRNSAIQSILSLTP